MPWMLFFGAINILWIYQDDYSEEDMKRLMDPQGYWKVKKKTELENPRGAVYCI